MKAFLSWLAVFILISVGVPAVLGARMASVEASIWIGMLLAWIAFGIFKLRRRTQ